MLRSLSCLLIVLLGAHPAWGDDRGPGADALATARSLTAAAAKHLQAEDYRGAEERLEQVLTLVDTDNARKNLALVLSRLGDRALSEERGSDALDLFDRALELHPGRVVYRVRRARALFLLAQEVEALRVANDLVETAPALGEAWLLKADVLERRGELAAALDGLDRAIALLHGGRQFLPRRAELARRVETEEQFLTHATGHFEVRYGADVDQKSVELALTLLEDAWSRVTADLGIAPRSAARVVLYSGGEFQDVTGAHGWVGALYVSGTLRVPVRNLERHRDTAARILSHEFTHHILREATPHLPIWWHEGIAQWAEATSEDADRRYERIARRMPALRDQGFLFTLAQLRETRIAGVRDADVVALFYAQAKSFVLWLVNRSGSRALTAFLLALGTSAEIEAAATEAFGAPVADLFQEWRASL